MDSVLERVADRKVVKWIGLRESALLIGNLSDLISGTSFLIKFGIGK